MDRDAISLRCHRTAGVANETGKVVRLRKDRAARGLHHHPAHLLGDVIELFLGQCKLNRIYHGSPQLLQIDQIVARRRHAQPI